MRRRRRFSQAAVDQHFKGIGIDDVAEPMQIGPVLINAFAEA